MTHTVLDEHPTLHDARCAVHYAPSTRQRTMPRTAPRTAPPTAPHRPPHRTAQGIAFEDAHVSGPDPTPTLYPYPYP